MSDLGAFGYGQQQPQDSSTDANVIDFIVRQRTAQMVTAKIVKVVKVTAGSGDTPTTVDVQPLVKQIDGNGFAVGHETVFGLRVFRPQWGAWAIVADPAVDDVGIIICTDRDSSSITTDGEEVTPQSRRRFSISDGIYFGGVLNPTPDATIKLNSDGTLDITDANGNEIKSGSGGFTLTGNVTINGTLTASGLVKGSDFSDGTVTSYKNHTHSVTTAPGTTSVPIPGT